MPSTTTTTPPPAESSKPEVSESTKKQTPALQSNGTSSKSEVAANAATAPKPSGTELKKQKQAEKAARRAQAILQKQGGQGASSEAKSSSQDRQAGAATQKLQGVNQANGLHRRTGSMAAETRHIPIRGTTAHPPAVVEASKSEDKTVEFFRHLYKPRMTGIAGANKDVHRAVLALGLQMSSYTICGSCARLVATLQAFKRVC